jgi:LiaI-LiaF-like transmembrane region
MASNGVNRTALIAGLLFVVLGVLFLLDALDAINLRGAYVWPVALIVVGLAVLWGGLTSSRRRGGEP